MRYKKSHIPNLKKIVTKATAIANSVMIQKVSKFAHDSKTAFVKQIERQDFSSFRQFPLSAIWSEKKAKSEADPRTMIATHNYINSIEIFTEMGKNSMLFVVGIDENAQAIDLEGNPVDFLLNDLQFVHEYGVESSADTWEIPPRKHWTPFYDKMHRQAVAVRRDIRQEVFKRWKRAGIV